MTQRWRLINGIELYDIQSDPGQRDDVAAQYPDVVASLRKGYEHWWNKVSQHFNGTIPIPVGHNTTEAVLLNAHDWRNNPVLCAWNQALVRQGLECNGYWEVDVLSTSRYTIELRRWPREEDQSISHGISGPLIAYNGIKNGYGGGRALPLVMARLRIGHAEYTQPIKPEDKSIVFPINIDAGETQLQTYLYDETDQDIGAYYVYVEQLSADTDV